MKGTFQFFQNFQPRFNLILSEENHSIFKNFCTASPNTMKPSSYTSCRRRRPPPPPEGSQRHEEHDLKHPSSVDLIGLQTKQTTLLHR